VPSHKRRRKKILEEYREKMQKEKKIRMKYICVWGARGLSDSIKCGDVLPP